MDFFLESAGSGLTRISVEADDYFPPGSRLQPASFLFGFRGEHCRTRECKTSSEKDLHKCTKISFVKFKLTDFL